MKTETVTDIPYPTPYGIETKMQKAEARAIIARSNGTLPTDWLELSNLASAFYVAGDDDKALGLARRVVEMNRNTSTLLNLAVILESYGRFEEALELGREASARDPVNPTAGSLYADGLIRMGRWEEGWPWYTKFHTRNGLNEFIPEWQGQSLRGKSILVIEGGGFGDNIFFIRWLERLKKAGPHITYACPESLVPLLLGIPWIDDFLPTRPPNGYLERLPLGFHYFTPLLSLAGKFGVTLENFSWGGPYIKADPEQSKLRKEVIRNSVGPKFGICWQAGEMAFTRHNRSLNDSQVQHILYTETRTGAEWVSLQYEVPPPAPMLRPAIKDWSDTAAIIDNLDLVVTVDTGVAHLCGAMGKPAWVILPGCSSWPFLLKRNDSPLYPSLRLFRNQGRGIGNAVEAVIKELEP